MSSDNKTAALAKICEINAVDGFDPASLAVEYTDLNTGEKRLRLPVMSQVAWFRLKYPNGRFTLNVAPGKDCFVATARVYKDFMDQPDCYLSEATASRGYLADKPTVSPREWAQTAALGTALRNAGFGLQFHAAGDSFDEPAVNELGELSDRTPATGAGMAEPDNTSFPESGGASPAVPATPAASPEPDEDPLDVAKKMPCPISKHKGKTLGDMIAVDPGALVWVANKFTGDPALKAAAKLICESAVGAAS
jgi:hypothetical protein